MPDKAERVYRFHQNTLAALKELVQAAGLTHPREISARHIVRRTAEQEVKLLANLLPFLKPGELLAAMRGEADWPHNVYRFYWDLARSDSFALVERRRLCARTQRRGKSARRRSFVDSDDDPQSEGRPVDTGMQCGGGRSENRHHPNPFVSRHHDHRVHRSPRRPAHAGQPGPARGLARTEGARRGRYRCTAPSAALPKLDPDALLIDLRLEDGAALRLVLAPARAPGRSGPRSCWWPLTRRTHCCSPTLRAGADAYLLEADLPTAAFALRRMVAGEATMAAPIAAQVLQFFNETAGTPQRSAAAVNERTLDWHSHAANPMRLSPGECWLLRCLAEGTRAAEVASRMAVSVEALGRRIGNVYRKLSWDLRSGSLSLLAA